MIRLVKAWPKCEVCLEGEGEIPDAVALAPQSIDAGLTIDRWVRVCGYDLATWWEGGDWMGNFVWLSKEVVE